jgi:hypothetical protein
MIMLSNMPGSERTRDARADNHNVCAFGKLVRGTVAEEDGRRLRVPERVCGFLTREA